MNKLTKSIPILAKCQNLLWLSLSFFVMVLPLLAKSSERPDYGLFPVHSREAFELRLKEALIQPPPQIIQYAMAQNESSRQPFSTTNVQEEGVDEPDKIQFDGRYLFTFSVGRRPIRAMPLIHCENPKDCSGSAPKKPTAAQLKIYDTQGAALGEPLKPLYELPLALEERPQGLLLTPNGFVVLIDVEQRSSQSGFAPNHTNKTRLRFYQFKGHQTPKQTADYLFDGKRMELRRVQGQLLLALSFWPEPTELDFRLAPEERRAKIESLPLKALLPNYSREGKTQTLITPSACLEESHKKPIKGIQVLVQIDPLSQSMHSQCVLVPNPEIYVSTDHAFLISNPPYSPQKQPKKVKLHQFGFTTKQPLEYQGSAQALGWIRGTRASFRLSEYQQHLRLVTDQPYNVHQLFIFSTQPKDYRLAKIATLPNQEHPTPIGKPDEEIHSVRFQGDEAYIVTFKRIDPLYKLNLSNPQQPIMEGALEIPGYSDYLQRLPNQLLLGSGYDVNEKTRRTSAKIALFDTQKSTPKVIESLQLNTAYTELSYDHHALTCLTEIPSIRCVMPILSSEGDQSWQAFNINTDQKTLKLNGKMTTKALVKANTRPAWLRSVIQGARWILIAEGEAMVTAWPKTQ
jgi:hypothetical protein